MRAKSLRSPPFVKFVWGRAENRTAVLRAPPWPGVRTSMWSASWSGAEFLYARQLELLGEEVAYLHRHTVVLSSMPGRLKRVDELVGLVLAQPVVGQLRVWLDRPVRLQPHFALVLDDLDPAHQQGARTSAAARGSRYEAR